MYKPLKPQQHAQPKCIPGMQHSFEHDALCSASHMPQPSTMQMQPQTPQALPASQIMDLVWETDRLCYPGTAVSGTPAHTFRTSPQQLWQHGICQTPPAAPACLYWHMVAQGLRAAVHASVVPDTLQHSCSSCLAGVPPSALQPMHVCMQHSNSSLGTGAVILAQLTLHAHTGYSTALR
jgi:hypothetical protein